MAACMSLPVTYVTVLFDSVFLMINNLLLFRAKQQENIMLRLPFLHILSHKQNSLNDDS